MVVKAGTDTTRNKVERVACYVRVSSQEQKLHGLSLDAQRMKLQEYADKNKMKIIDWYVDEGVSGRKLIKNRPELQRMIHDAEKGNFDRIIFIKLDRFFRSVAEYHECMKRIAPVVWSTTEEEYDLTTANGRLLVNMKLTIAELEADQTGERIKIVNEYKVKEGIPVTGKWGFAFTIVKGENGRKKLIHNPETEELVYDYIAHFEKHQCLNKSYDYIRSKYDYPVSSTKLKRLLKNRLLIGEYRDNPNYCEPYIDKVRFERIQDILSRNVKENAAPNRTYLFTGLIRCPECGRILAGSANRQPNGNRTAYNIYKKYICKHHSMEKQCTFKKRISENVLERMLLENIENELERVKVEASVTSEINAPKNDNDALSAELDRLNYAWQKGRLKPEEYDAEYERLTEKIRKNNERTTHKIDFTEIDNVLCEGWKGIYEKLNDENKRAFWRSIIKEIHLTWNDEIKEIKEIIFF